MSISSTAASPPSPWWTDPDGTLHEIYTGYIFVGNQLLGELSYDSGRSDLRWHRCSYAMFCRTCGEVWARIVMHNSYGEQQAFTPVEVACEQHKDPWNVPGSLLANHLDHLLNDLPPEALVREFRIHLKELGT